jgi:hypothetical protein
MSSGPTTNTKVGGKLLERRRKMFIRILHQEVKNLLQQRDHIGDFRAAFSKRSHFHQGTTGVGEGARFQRGFHDNKSDERAKRLLIVMQKKWLRLRIYSKG